jgi:hypothetical protein
MDNVDDICFTCHCTEQDVGGIEASRLKDIQWCVVCEGERFFFTPTAAEMGPISPLYRAKIGLRIAKLHCPYKYIIGSLEHLIELLEQ